ncbi:Cytochrome c-type biogenesis protein CcmE homolog, mitochondrial [Linum perenne]
MVFYVTPTDAMEQYKANPKKTTFRLGGLVLEGQETKNGSTAVVEAGQVWRRYESGGNSESTTECEEIRFQVVKVLLLQATMLQMMQMMVRN